RDARGRVHRPRRHSLALARGRGEGRGGALALARFTRGGALALARRSAMNEPAVLARGLTRAFGRFVAVDRVTFSVAAGEVYGFLGPNGAGKTTTLRMLTGLLRPSAGEGRVAGVDIAGDTAALRRRIGYMSQKFSLYTDQKVAKSIELMAGLYCVQSARCPARQSVVLG